MALKVEVVTEATEELVEAAAGLLPQLSPHRGQPTLQSVTQFLAAEANTLLVARVDGAIAGMTTVVLIPAIDGKLRTFLEDVVVSSDFRRQGVGDALVEAGIAKARELGSPQLQLQSNPKREAAQRLYQRHGFEPYGTTVFRYDLLK